jgi:hypothetical protein
VSKILGQLANLVSIDKDFPLVDEWVKDPQHWMWWSGVPARSAQDVGEFFPRGEVEEFWIEDIHRQGEPLGYFQFKPHQIAGEVKLLLLSQARTRQIGVEAIRTFTSYFTRQGGSELTTLLNIDQAAALIAWYRAGFDPTTEFPGEKGEILLRWHNPGVAVPGQW